MSEIDIRIEQLSKKYHIGQPEYYKTLRGKFFQPFHSRPRKWNPLKLVRPDEEEVWALRNIDLEVRRGEIVGIVGRNGAGKSTLLKILARITEPTLGTAMVRGKTSSLLEVGTGFHQELTGRENVFLNGSILGMKRSEIIRRFDQIVEFSGIARFLDTPVKHYSSGMRVRLAFSVAAYLQPNILFVDEVLAVGDLEFQQKCLARMKEIAGEGRTILFVSHNLAAIKEMCESCVVLENGEIRFRGTVDDGIATYLESYRNGYGETDGISHEWLDSCIESGGKAVSVIHCDRPFSFKGKLRLPEDFDYGELYLKVKDSRRYVVVRELVNLNQIFHGALGAGEYHVKVDLPVLWLTPGVYTMYFGFLGHSSRSREEQTHIPGEIMFSVAGSFRGAVQYLPILQPPLMWNVEHKAASVCVRNV